MKGNRVGSSDEGGRYYGEVIEDVEKKRMQRDYREDIETVQRNNYTIYSDTESFI